MQKIRIKKAFAMIMVIVMLISVNMSTVNAAANPEELGYLPVRAIFEKQGSNVTWCDYERVIHIEWRGNVFVLNTRQPLAYVNDEVRILPYGGIILWEGRSFIAPNDLVLLLLNVFPLDVDDGYFTDIPWEYEDNFESMPVDIEALTEIAINFMEKFAAGYEISGDVSMLREKQPISVGSFADIYTVSKWQRGSFIDWHLMGYQEYSDFVIFDFAVNNVIGSGGYSIVVNSNGKIDGIGSLGFAFEPIPVAENATYTAYPIIIGKGTMWELDGLLTMPHVASAENPVPAVVLVHDTGVQNMDLSIFDNRPFHDIATYLSSNGIAVIRYHKRALIHSCTLWPRWTSFEYYSTVCEEIVDDALLAIETLRSDPRVGSIFVAGKGLGGTLAPRIAEESGLDGVILLGASPRSLFEIAYSQSIQNARYAVLAEQISQEQADDFLLEAYYRVTEARNLPNLTEEEMYDMVIFGLPAIYQRSLHDSLPLPIISRNIIPTLILHGDRDFNVCTDKDFNLFIEYTKYYDHVQTILYEGLTQIFTQAQTDYNHWREYMVAGHVDAQVLRDIVEWIMSNS